MDAEKVNTPQRACATPQTRTNILPHLALLLANVGWGAMSPVSKSILLSGQISPVALSALRIGGAALLLLLISPLLPASVQASQPIARRDWWRVAVAATLIISANQGLFILGIGYTSPIDSSVMSALTPLITMLLAAAVLGYPVTPRKFGGVTIGLAGVVILVTTGVQGSRLASNPLLGDTLCFAAQACAAVYLVAFDPLIKRYSPVSLMKWMFVIAACTYVPCCIPSLIDVPWGQLSVRIWLDLAYIIIVATAFCFLVLPYAQQRLKPTVVTIYNYMQPVVAAIVAVSLGVGEFGWIKAIATALIFIGVWLVTRIK